MSTRQYVPSEINDCQCQSLFSKISVKPTNQSFTTRRVRSTMFNLKKISYDCMLKRSYTSSKGSAHVKSKIRQRYSGKWKKKGLENCKASVLRSYSWFYKTSISRSQLITCISKHTLVRQLQVKAACSAQQPLQTHTHDAPSVTLSNTLWMQIKPPWWCWN